MPPRPVRLAALWSAGFAFVASLAFFAWTYLVRFDHSAPATGLSAVAVNASLFGAFALHHSLLARPWAKDKIAALVPSSLERAVFVWMASGLFFIVCREWQPVVGVLYWHTGSAALLHRGVQLLGLAIIAGAVAAIGPLDLAGTRPNQGAAPPVVTRGPYKMVRHPIYLGWVLLVFGTPHMNGTRLSFSVISTAYLLLAMPWEERALLAALGARYGRYRARVRWRLIPGLY